MDSQIWTSEQCTTAPSVEIDLPERERLAGCSFTTEELTALIWLRCWYQSGGSDPQQFADPETLDITRTLNRHLAFSKGIHMCLGAPLARLEGQIALGTLLQRFPNLRLACDPEQLNWNPVPYLRGVKALPVAF